MKHRKEIAELILKAKESLRAANDLFENAHYDFSVSRAYYGMFYATQALLLTKNLFFSSHKAVISAFGKEFIKTEIFPKRFHRYLRDGFVFRQLGDYGAPGSISKEKARALIAQAEKFVAGIAEYLKIQ